MHSNLPYQHGQLSTFLLRQSETVPSTVNTSVSATDSIRAISPGSSHIYMMQHHEQFGSEINVLKTPMPHKLLKAQTFCPWKNQVTGANGPSMSKDLNSNTDPGLQLREGEKRMQTLVGTSVE